MKRNIKRKEKDQRCQHLPLAKRYRNFNEVVLGYQAQAAVEEAKRCLHCYLREEE